MTATREGREAYAACEAQEATDCVPECATMRATTRARSNGEDAREGDDDDGRVHRVRVIVEYKDDYDVERAMLERVMRLKTETASLCAGGTPPPTSNRRGVDAGDDEGDDEGDDDQDQVSIQELAAILGVETRTEVDDALRSRDMAEPCLPMRFSELLGMRRIYEVESNDIGVAMTACRQFICRIAGGSWSHFGLIEGAITIEIPTRYDVTVVKAPAIDARDAPLAAYTAHKFLTPALQERHGAFVYVGTSEPPRKDVWDALDAAGALETLLKNGTKVCLCWPLDFYNVIGNAPNEYEIEAFTSRQMRLLKTDPRHWRARLGHVARTKNIAVTGDMTSGVSLAFVCVRASTATTDAHKFNRLAYALECLFAPSDTASGADVAPAAVAAPVRRKPARVKKSSTKGHESSVLAAPEPEPEPEPELEPMSPPPPASPPPPSAPPPPSTRAVPPKKRVLAPKRECTMADPFAFDVVAFQSHDDDNRDDDQNTPTLGKFAKAKRAPTTTNPKKTTVKHRAALGTISSSQNAPTTTTASPARELKAKKRKIQPTRKPALELRFTSPPQKSQHATTMTTNAREHQHPPPPRVSSHQQRRAKQTRESRVLASQTSETPPERPRLRARAADPAAAAAARKSWWIV